MRVVVAVRDELADVEQTPVQRARRHVGEGRLGIDVQVAARLHDVRAGLGPVGAAQLDGASGGSGLPGDNDVTGDQGDRVNARGTLPRGAGASDPVLAGAAAWAAESAAGCANDRRAAPAAANTPQRPGDGLKGFPGSSVGPGRPGNG